MKKIVPIALSLAWVVGLGVQLFGSANGQPSANTQINSLLNQNESSEIRKAPEFALKDLNGKDVKFSDSNGKVRLVYFFYASCDDVCPITTKQMEDVQEKLKEKGIFGKDVQFVSITVDPKRDTENVLKAYANKFNADPSGWTFLRGDEKETQQIADKFGGHVEKDTDGKFLHSDRLFLVDRNGSVVKQYVKAETQEILKDIIKLAKE
ncbi:SCO family protein [Effusibacillus consociatus]|uniref:SCO family protein n=1 Tax=Effusibacillus consociatus TaxID=1117041 RepID=A0ABV9Q5W1_9BACL